MNSLPIVIIALVLVAGLYLIQMLSHRIFKDKLDIREKQIKNSMVFLLGIMAIMQAFSPSVQTNKTDIAINKDVPAFNQEKNDTASDESKNMSASNFNGEVAENYADNPLSTSPEDLLILAEAFYEERDYSRAFKIYDEYSILNKNSVALCNLGFLYANGLGTDLNYDMASAKYAQSWGLGNLKAVSNHLAANLRAKRPYQQLVDIGVQHNIKPIVAFFLACKTRGQQPLLNSLESYNDDYSLAFDEVYEEKYIGVFVGEKPQNVDYLKCEYIGPISSTNGLSLWTISNVSCKYIFLLEECFQNYGG